jgi:hypothetical protein
VCVCVIAFVGVRVWCALLLCGCVCVCVFVCLATEQVTTHRTTHEHND